MGGQPFLERLRFPSLQSYLEGSWNLDRIMRHRGEDASIMGTVDAARAVFSPVPGQSSQLHYREDGMVKFATMASAVPFYREYLYTFTNALEAEVSFFCPDKEEEHLKPFHSIRVSQTGEVEASEHLCINDLYAATITIASDVLFQAEWTVTGPQKNYTIFSSFSRAGDPNRVAN